MPVELGLEFRRCRSGRHGTREAGVDRFQIAPVLNHRSVTHSKVTAVYDRYRCDWEKRAALEKWAELLAEIVDCKPAPTAAPAWPVARALVRTSTSSSHIESEGRSQCQNNERYRDPAGAAVRFTSVFTLSLRDTYNERRPIHSVGRGCRSRSSRIQQVTRCTTR